MSGDMIKKVVDNALITVAARVSMLSAVPVLTMVAWLGGQWLNERFEKTDARMIYIERMANTAGIQTQVNDRRLIQLETRQTADSMANDKFQDATLKRLDGVQNAVAELTKAVAGLAAVVQNITEAKRTEK